MLTSYVQLLNTVYDCVFKIDVANPWDCHSAMKWDSMTVQQFIDETCWTRLLYISLLYEMQYINDANIVLLLRRAAKDFGRVFVSLNVACEPHDASLLWLLWYVKNCGGVKRIWEVDDGAQV